MRTALPITPQRLLHGSRGGAAPESLAQPTQLGFLITWTVTQLVRPIRQAGQQRAKYGIAIHAPLCNMLHVTYLRNRTHDPGRHRCHPKCSA